jgi:hypothetical protein
MRNLRAGMKQHFINDMVRFFDQEMRVYRPVQTAGVVTVRRDRGLAACEVVTFTLTYLD